MNTGRSRLAIDASPGKPAGSISYAESATTPHLEAGKATRHGAVAFIHRFGSSLNAHPHFHCAVIDGVFDSAAGGVAFHAAGGLDAYVIANVQAGGRLLLLRVLARRGLLPGDGARAMARWAHDDGFSIDASVCIAAADRARRERLPRYSRPAAVRYGSAA